MNQRATSGSPFEEQISFSRAARNGDFIAVSGTAPLTPDGATAHCGDLYQQTTRCLEIIKHSIESLDGCIEDTIRTRIFLTDMDRWRDAAKAHGDFFKEVRPACSFIGVSRFINENWLVEVEADCYCATQSEQAG